LRESKEKAMDNDDKIKIDRLVKYLNLSEDPIKFPWLKGLAIILIIPPACYSITSLFWLGGVDFESEAMRVFLALAWLGILSEFAAHARWITVLGWLLMGFGVVGSVIGFEAKTSSVLGWLAITSYGIGLILILIGSFVPLPRWMKQQPRMAIIYYCVIIAVIAAITTILAILRH
jgi:hypothetical protein